MPGSKRSPGFRPVLEAPFSAPPMEFMDYLRALRVMPIPACAFLRAAGWTAAPALRRALIRLRPIPGRVYPCATSNGLDTALCIADMWRVMTEKHGFLETLKHVAFEDERRRGKAHAGPSPARVRLTAVFRSRVFSPDGCAF